MNGLPVVTWCGDTYKELVTQDEWDKVLPRTTDVPGQNPAEGVDVVWAHFLLSELPPNTMFARLITVLGQPI